MKDDDAVKAAMGEILALTKPISIEVCNLVFERSDNAAVAILSLLSATLAFVKTVDSETDEQKQIEKSLDSMLKNILQGAAHGKITEESKNDIHASIESDGAFNG